MHINLIKCEKKLLSVYYLLIIIVNLNCLPLDIILTQTQTPVQIQSDIVVLKNIIKGTIGFCGIYDYFSQGYAPKTHPYYFQHSYIGYTNLTELQYIFLKIIDKKEVVDCRYELIKDFNFSKFITLNYSSLQRPQFVTPKGYIEIFDEKDKNGNWKLYYNSLIFFNDNFKCDYYLTGKIKIYFVDDEKKKEKLIQPTLLLALYDNKGCRVWSKLYQREYEDADKKQKLDELYYASIINLLRDCKEEINNDLSFNPGVSVFLCKWHFFIKELYPRNIPQIDSMQLPIHVSALSTVNFQETDPRIIAKLTP